MAYSDNNDNYPSLIQDTINAINNPRERTGKLVSDEIKKKDKQLSESLYE